MIPLRFALIALTLLLVGFWLSSDLFKADRPDASGIEEEGNSLPIQRTEVTSGAATSDPSQHTGTQTATIEDDPVKASLQEKYGHSISHGHTRIKAIEALLAYLKKTYPDSWQTQLSAYLNRIFPRHAEAMLSLHQDMENYNRWLETERMNLRSLSPEARRQLLWDMRYNFFGEQAQEIWQEAIKQDRIAGTLAQLNTSEGKLSDKREAYVEALYSVYKEEAERKLTQRRQELTDRFLALSEVQSALKQLPKEDRYRELAELRRLLGMDEPAVQRWQSLDQKRDSRWENGQAYMKARKQLINQMPETEQEAALSQLRRQYFGPEAEIIRNEEASGFFGSIGKGLLAETDPLLVYDPGLQ